MFWREFCQFILLLFKTGLKHYLVASINDENLGTKLNKIVAPFGSRTGKIGDKIMKSSAGNSPWTTDVSHLHK